jgi:gliding motility-associated-like protein
MATGVSYTVAATASGACASAQSNPFSLSDVSPVVVSVSPNTAAICSGGSVTLTASGASTYSWTPNSHILPNTGATVVVNPTTTTTYTVTGTIANGCSASAQVTITVGTPPNANAGNDTTIVCGGTATLGQTVTPTPPNNTLAAPACTHPGRFMNGSLTQGGAIYTHSVTTTGGITNINNTNTFVDVINLNPANDAMGTLLWYSDFTNHFVEACSGDIFYLNITGIDYVNPNSNEPFQCRVWIDWNNDGAFAANEIVYTSPLFTTSPMNITNAPIQVPANQPWGVFRMRIRWKDNSPFVDSDNSCTYGNPHGTVAPYGGYTGSSSGYNYMSDEIEEYTVKISCGGNNSSSGNITYQWTPPIGLNDTTIPNPTANPPSTTTYTVTVTDTSTGCQSTDQVTVVISQPTPTFNNPGPICSGETFTLPTTSTNGVTGTWSPAIDNTQTTTYTFTPTAGACTDPVNMTVVVNPLTVPTFNNPGPICSGATLTLPTTSINNITGTWSPAVNNTQTTTYTFTPNTGQCADVATMTVVVDNQAVPTFTNPGPICTGTALTLPTTSDNGVTGTWSPAVDNTQTTTYTFSPTNGGCAQNATMTVVVSANMVPTFTNPGPICSGDALVLPTTSNNGVAGTWAPAVDNTQTTTYTFTPSTAGCAQQATMTVVVNPLITPDVTDPAPICSGASLTLPSTSDNGIAGTWSPAINNTQTTMYTFTPNNGQCSSTATVTAVVNQATTPTFTNPGPLCSETAFTMPSTSDNGVPGTWSPAIDNTQTTTYTFTPATGECASSATMTVVVDQPVVPTFTNPGPICEGDVFVLPTTSNNGVAGTWSPAVNNTQTTAYTFTPSSGSCAQQATMTVVVNPKEVPTFVNPGPLCEGTNFTLPTTSINGIVGTWSPSVNTTQTTNYTFTPTSGGCVTGTTMTVVINPMYDVYASGNAKVCQGNAVPNISFTGEGGVAPYTFTYTIGGGTPQTVVSQGNTAPVNVGAYPGMDASVPGCYDVVVTVSSAGGCEETKTFKDYVCIYPTPNASFTPSPDKLSDESVETSTSSMLNYTTGATSYSWNFGDGTHSNEENPTHVFSAGNDTSYVVELIATNQYGCADTAYQTITIDELLFYVPNAFTPDGDEHNNTFKPVMTSGYDPQTYTLDIFNRWGEKIFTSHDVSVGWDGTYDGLMSPDGVYTWKISFKVANFDDRRVYLGHVTLIR